QDVHVGGLEFEQQCLNDCYVGLLEKIEDVHLFRVERILEAGSHVGNLCEIDRKQKDVRDIDLPGTPQDAGAGDDEATLAHVLGVDEGGGIAGDENEDFGRVAETIVANRDPGDEVGGNVIEKDQPQRDTAEQIEPQIAFGGRHRGLGGCRSFLHAA